MASFMVLLGAPVVAPLNASLFHEEPADMEPETNDQDHFLPRSLPLVGFLRHAPQQALYEQLDLLMRRRSAQVCEAVDVEVAPFLQRSSLLAEPAGALPRKSPYVGFQRHAPPSPTLCFGASTGSPTLRLSMPDLKLSSGNDDLDESFELEPTRAQQLPHRLPEEVWALILSIVIEVPAISSMSCVARGFPEVVRSQLTWRGRAVRVPPSCVQSLAPRLPAWLPAWRTAAKLIVPSSAQLLSEVSRRAPDLPVEVAWRFGQHLKGEGVEVFRHGLAVRRIAEEELVVMGDAAIVAAPGHAPYLEVCLDERGEGSGDNLNDFGFGVTACDPKDISQHSAVADDVPRSWVVDFTMNSVVLSVNNKEAAKGLGVSADDLCEGDRVGLRVVADALEVYINGTLRERLVPASEDCVPPGIGLFPVLDLYGRTVQVSRTDAEEPLP